MLVVDVMLLNLIARLFDFCAAKWLKLTSDDVKEQIYKLAKKGLTPSQIGKLTISAVITVAYCARCHFIKLEVDIICLIS